MAAPWSGDAGRSRRLIDAAVVAAGLTSVGIVDFLTGVEYRVFPLYFIPLSWAAWRLGRYAALIAAAAATFAWGESNYLAGLRYSDPSVWAVNLVMQGAAFAVIGLLLATLRGSLEREASLSRTDPLTRILNARAFQEECQRIFALADRYGHPLTLAYMDLDRFKTINDTHGHAVGDAVLRHVADVLRAHLRDVDVYARLGGDEFAILLPETGPGEAGPLLEKLRRHIADVPAGRPAVTVTIEAVSSSRPSGTVERFLQHADSVMYGAKAAGRNRLDLDVNAPAAPGGRR